MLGATATGHQAALMTPTEILAEQHLSGLSMLYAALPDDWEVGTPDPADRFQVARLTRLLRDHERDGRGWAGSGVDDVLAPVGLDPHGDLEELVN